MDVEYARVYVTGVEIYRKAHSRSAQLCQRGRLSVRKRPGGADVPPAVIGVKSDRVPHRQVLRGMLFPFVVEVVPLYGCSQAVGGHPAGRVGQMRQRSREADGHRIGIVGVR